MGDMESEILRASRNSPFDVRKDLSGPGAFSGTTPLFGSGPQHYVLLGVPDLRN